ncbi:MAG: hypothetical protein WC421_03270 [Elusimicrobiales bacterium]
MQERTAFLWMLYAGLVALALVCERVEATRSGLEMARLQREIRLKQAGNEHIRFQIDELKSPAQLEQAARARGLTAPEPGAMTILGDIPRPAKTSGWLARLP